MAVIFTEVDQFGIAKIVESVAVSGGTLLITTFRAPAATEPFGISTVFIPAGFAAPVSTPVNTVGAATLSAAAMTGGIITRGGVQTANFSDTTDTAANIIAALGVQTSQVLRVLNDTAFQQTIVGGAGVTVSASGKPAVIAPNCFADILMTVSGNAVTLLIEIVDDQGIDNLNAARDPLATDDNTLGYGPGSLWINTSAGASAEWTNISAATGAAVWSFSGSKLGDPEPAGIQTQAGGAVRGSVLGKFGEEGNIYRNVSSSIAGNGADANDDILLGVQVPANIFDVATRMLQLIAFGNFAANGNNKVVRIWVNPTMAGQTLNADGSITGGRVTGAGAGVLLFDSGNQTGNNIGWNLQLNYGKFGAGGSNNQTFQLQPIFGGTHGGVTKAQQATQPENAVMNFVVTGSSPTSSMANDVVLEQLWVNWMN